MQQQQQRGGELDSPSFDDYFDLRAAVWDADVSSTATLVAIRLVDNWPRIWPSLNFICRKTKLKERTVRYALRELEGAGVIEIEHRGHTKTRRYWFLDEQRQRIVIPRVGRRRLPTGGDDEPPTGDPDDSEPESAETAVSRRQQVPPNTPKVGGQLVPLPRGQHLPPPGARTAPPPGHGVPPKEVTSNKQPKGGGIARAGARSRDAARARGRKRPSPPRPLITSWDGWTLSDALRAELIAMGVSAAKLAPRLRRCRNRPGDLGKGVESLDEYIREMAERYWAVWDRADAVSSGGTGAPSAFPSSARGGDGSSPSKAAERLPGLPAWVYPQHAKFAAAARLDLAECARAYFDEQRRGGNPNPHRLPRCDVYGPFMRFLESKAPQLKQSGKKAKAA